MTYVPYPLSLKNAAVGFLNSLAESGENPGPRPDRRAGFVSASVPATEGSERTRSRDVTFADHYSQARQFWKSQTPTEQGHIVAAFTAVYERPNRR